MRISRMNSPPQADGVKKLSEKHTPRGRGMIPCRGFTAEG